MIDIKVSSCSTRLSRDALLPREAQLMLPEIAEATKHIGRGA